MSSTTSFARRRSSSGGVRFSLDFDLPVVTSRPAASTAASLLHPTGSAAASGSVSKVSAATPRSPRRNHDQRSLPRDTKHSLSPLTIPTPKSSTLISFAAAKESAPDAGAALSPLPTAPLSPLASASQPFRGHSSPYDHHRCDHTQACSSHMTDSYSYPTPRISPPPVPVFWGETHTVGSTASALSASVLPPITEEPCASTAGGHMATGSCCRPRRTSIAALIPPPPAERGKGVPLRVRVHDVSSELLAVRWRIGSHGPSSPWSSATMATSGGSTGSASGGEGSCGGGAVLSQMTAAGRGSDSYARCPPTPTTPTCLLDIAQRDNAKTVAITPSVSATARKGSLPTRSLRRRHHSVDNLAAAAAGRRHSIAAFPRSAHQYNQCANSSVQSGNTSSVTAQPALNASAPDFTSRNNPIGTVLEAARSVEPPSQEKVTPFLAAEPAASNEVRRSSPAPTKPTAATTPSRSSVMAISSIVSSPTKRMTVNSGGLIPASFVASPESLVETQRNLLAAKSGKISKKSSTSSSFKRVRSITAPAAVPEPMAVDTDCAETDDDCGRPSQAQPAAFIHTHYAPLSTFVPLTDYQAPCAAPESPNMPLAPLLAAAALLSPVSNPTPSVCPTASVASRSRTSSASSAAGVSSAGVSSASNCTPRAAKPLTHIQPAGSGPGVCHFCQARKTGQWRRGPAGQRTLCNACGINWTKKIRAEARRGGCSLGEAEKRVAEGFGRVLKVLGIKAVVKAGSGDKEKDSANGGGGGGGDDAPGGVVLEGNRAVLEGVPLIPGIACWNTLMRIAADVDPNAVAGVVGGPGAAVGKKKEAASGPAGGKKKPAGEAKSGKRKKAEGDDQTEARGRVLSGTSSLHEDLFTDASLSSVSSLSDEEDDGQMVTGETDGVGNAVATDIAC
ncbi:hypothetical protein DFJ73DRAFT_758608 [Zopfochytrium polystomum]|nr:hypothetical protein DFJ73DRAFT_758608 [Zopfochytrium polystomum]